MFEEKKIAELPAHPWLNEPYGQLLKLLNSGRLAHAILLHAPQGYGKLSLALKFAEAILCQKRTEAACGQCTSCRLIKNSSHPDLFTIAPEKAAVPLIKIEAIRELIEKFSRSSNLDRGKVLVVDQVEAMNTAAANAFLKTLEEPRPRQYLLLVCHRPDLLLPTVRSRCVLLNCANASSDKHLEWLKSVAVQKIKDPIADGKIKLALQLAHGAPLKALELLRDQSVWNFLVDLTSLATLPSSDAIAISQKWHGHPAPHLFDWLLTINSLLIRQAYGKHEAKLIAKLSTAVTETSLPSLLAITKKLQQIRRETDKGHHPDCKIFLDRLLIDWQRAFS